MKRLLGLDGYLELYIVPVNTGRKACTLAFHSTTSLPIASMTHEISCPETL